MQDEKTEQFEALVTNLFDLTSLLKCPICLEFLKNPVELKCKHMFCNSCIQSHARGKSYHCPVCIKTAMKKYMKPVDEAKGALNYAQEMYKQLKKMPRACITDCGVMRPASGQNSIKDTSDDTPIKKKIIHSKTPSISVSSRPGNQQKSKSVELKPKKVTQKMKKTDENIDIAAKQLETNYNYPKLIVKIPKEEQIKEPYKQNVLTWLHNRKNLFERENQTQQLITNSPAKIPSNLVSVSQRPKHRQSLPPREITPPANNNKRKCRSMESSDDKALLKFKLPESSMQNSKPNKFPVDTTIFDSPVDNTEIEESKIEDIDSIPKMLLCKAVEEKCLETIDENASRTDKVSKKRKKPGDKDVEDNTDEQMKPDWKRINKLANKIDRVAGIPKKLTLVSASGNSGKENKKIKLKGSDMRPGTPICKPNTFKGNVSETKKKKLNAIASSNRKTEGNVHNLSLSNTSKEMEISKKQKCLDETNVARSSMVVDFNVESKSQNKTNTKTPKNKTNKSRCKSPDVEEVFLSNTQQFEVVPEKIMEQTTIEDDDIFLVPTQIPLLSSNTIAVQCEKFLAQFNSLTEQLSYFLLEKSPINYALLDNYNKFTKVQQHLQTMQPKFSSLSCILSQHESEDVMQLPVDQSVQTDGVEFVDSKQSIRTIHAQVQTMHSKQSISRMVQTEISDITPQAAKLMIQKGVQAPLSSIPPRAMPAKEYTMKATLDFIDFDTQAAIKRFEDSKRETLTNANTEQMPLTDFIIQLQEDAENNKNNIKLADSDDVLYVTPDDREDRYKASTNLVRISRRKLDYSANDDASSTSQIGVAKCSKLLSLSGSEDDEPVPIVNQFLQQNLIVDFDSESQKLTQNDLNSQSFDKHVDDVWSRLKEQFNTSIKSTEVDVGIQNPPNTEVKSENSVVLQTAIKANTNDLIAKCEQMMTKNDKKKTQTLEEKLQEKLMEPVNTPASLNINKTKGPSSVGDFMTDSIFCDNDDLFDNFTSICTSSKDIPKSTLHNLHSDLIYKDSNSSISTNILDECASAPVQGTNIQILQHIRISGPSNANVRINPQIVAEVDATTPIHSDEDLIYSTPETTPTKFHKKPFLESEDLLAPPPQFQDSKLEKQSEATSQNISEAKATSQPEFKNTWLGTQTTANLSPIQGTSSHPPTEYPTPNNKHIPCKQVMGSHPGQRRACSTPHCKPTKCLQKKPAINQSLSLSSSAYANSLTRSNQPQISSYMRKEARISEDHAKGDDILISQKKKAQPVIACSRLSKTEMIVVNALTKFGLAKFSSTFDASVTHMIVSTDDCNRSKDLTIKYVKAVAAGLWVVNCKWAQESLTHKKLLPEEYYEVIDVSGLDGPRQSRLYRKSKPLFAGFKMFVTSPPSLISKQEVEEIINELGGITVSSVEKLHPFENYTCLIITESSTSQSDEQFIKYQDWAEKFCVAPMEFEWLARSIGAYKVQNLRRYALCTDETICELAYPKHLMGSFTYSYTETI